MNKEIGNFEESEKETIKKTVLVNSLNAETNVSQQYDRNKYVDKKKMKEAKDKAYGDKKTTKDHYTGEEIHKSHNAAKSKYKGKVSSHQGETDHTISAKSAHDFAKKLPYINDADVKKAVNRSHNFKEVSKKNNSAKGKKSNSEYAKDNKDLSNKARVKLVAEDVKETVLVKGELTLKSMGRESKEISKRTAGVNLAKVMQGEKNLSEAAIDTISDTIKGEINATTLRTGVNIAQNGLDKLSETVGKKAAEEGSKKFLGETVSKSLGVINQNIDKIVTTAILCGDALKEYLNGNISVSDMLLTFGESAVNMTFMTTGAAIGGSVGMTIGASIGFAFGNGIGCCIGAWIGDTIGEIIGTAVGYLIGSSLCKTIIGLLKTGEYVKEQLRLQKMYDDFATQIENSRIKLEEYLNYLHIEHRANISNGFFQMKQAIENNDINKISESIDIICSQFGLETEFKTREEFESIIIDSDYIFDLG